MTMSIKNSRKGEIKIAVLGAAGGIGQPLSLLLKTQLASKIQGIRDRKLRLALYDISKITKGVAHDLSHVNTPIILECHVPKSKEDTETLDTCLSGADVVVISAGFARKQGMTREDLFSCNARIMVSIAQAIAKNCDLQRVFVLLISNPVNSLVPLIIQVLIKTADQLKIDSTGVERHVFGVTGLDSIRASAFIQELSEYENNHVENIIVVGGHSGDTIVPLFGNAQKHYGFSDQMKSKLVDLVKHVGDEIMEYKQNLGSATLSIAYASYQIIAEFIDLLLETSDSIKINSYISLLDRNHKPIVAGADKIMAVFGGVTYISIPVIVRLKDGITDADITVLDHIDDYERENLLPACIKDLKKSIEHGLLYKF